MKPPYPWHDWNEFAEDILGGIALFALAVVAICALFVIFP